MSSYTVLLDANVLYPAPLRDILLQLAVDDLFRAKWTETIHQEWIEALLKKEPHRERKKLERTRDMMNEATRDCLVSGYESLIEGLQLPDPDDRHVLAAAIVGRCDAIITQNIKDFPLTRVNQYGIEILHPDVFLTNYLNLHEDAFCNSIKEVRARLKQPPSPVEKYLDTLSQQGLPHLTLKLKELSNRI